MFTGALNFDWKMVDCMGTGSTFIYYPDWSGSNEGCLNDGNEPRYMLYNPSLWMQETLTACCEKYYPYNLATCTGSTSAGSTKFYMDWEADVCVQDCEGAAPCGGLAESWDIKYDTKINCCEENMPFDKKKCIRS